MPGWSEELAGLKREVKTRKRRIRCAAPVRRAKVVDEYLKKKQEYELLAAKVQVESWKGLCKQDKEGDWEGIYRVIGRAMRSNEDMLVERDGEVLGARDFAKL